MSFYLLIVLVALVFIVGIIYVLRLRQSSFNEKDVVPLSDISEIKALNATETSVAVTENSVAKKSVMKNPSEIVSDYSDADSSLSNFIEQGNTSMQSNSLSASDIQDNDALMSEINTLKETILDQERQLAQKDQILTQMQTSLTQERQHIEAFDNQLRNIDQTLKALDKRGKDVLETIELQREGLMSQIEQRNELCNQWREKCEVLNQQGSRDLNEAGKTIRMLRSAVTLDHDQTIEHLKSELTKAIVQVEEYKNGRGQLFSQNDDLRSEVKKIDELNAQLSQKNKMLQYELTKQQAQVLGLERICEDFKLQIESIESIR